MGTPRAAAVSLERILADGHEVAAVYTQPDRPAGRGRKIAMSPVKELALEKGIPVYQPTKLRTAEALEQFRSHGADAAVVVAYGRILPADFLNAFPNGAINVHFSLLPKYRGAAPVNWAIVHGEKVTGVTTMQMDEGLDTGPILLQKETPIADEETSVELMDRLAVAGADLLSETLRRLPELTPVPQDEAGATYAPIMKKEDGLISWMLDARDIANRVRGFQPFPTAFTFYQGKKFTVWSARPADIAHELSEPGTVLAANQGRLQVACGGDSVIELVEVQLEGKKRLAVRDFLNGVMVAEGEILGP